MDDTEGTWRVGALARATGLTVRTLHYYDEIGLLSPTRRTSGGHRAYSADDVQRLYRICALRQLGLPLAGVQGALNGEQWDLEGALVEQLHSLAARLSNEQRLHSRLASLVQALQTDRQPSTTDLLEVLEQMNTLEAGVQRRIGILVYKDLQRAHNYLIDTFGLGPGDLTQDGEGRIVHGELQAGDGVLWLHPEAPDYALASPETLGRATGMVAVIVDDVDAHYRYATEHGATIRYEPIDQPYGYREYSAIDCEGHLWSFMQPLT
jgi:MerR family transcriptional regulator, thiopeptide resistance regulator